VRYKTVIMGLLILNSIGTIIKWIIFTKKNIYTILLDGISKFDMIMHIILYYIYSKLDITSFQISKYRIYRNLTLYA